MKNVVLLFLCFVISMPLFPISTASGKMRSRHEMAHKPRLKKTFALRLGKDSGITSLAVGRNGNIYGAGFSDNFGVVLKFDPKLNSLVEMEKFKGLGEFKDIAVDSTGSIYVAGAKKTGSLESEAFIVKLSSDLRLINRYPFKGGSKTRFNAITIDQQDNVYAIGEISDNTFNKNLFLPPAGAYDRSLSKTQNQSKVIIVKMHHDMKTLIAATFLGGNSRKHGSYNKGHGIAVDRDGNIVVCGQTTSTDFPVTQGSFGESLAGKSDGFVAKFDPHLKSLLASTYLGGKYNESSTTLVVDKGGKVFIGGWSESPDMLVFQKGFNVQHSGNEEDGFVVRMDSDLQNIEAATFIGGNSSSGKIVDNIKAGDDKVAKISLSENGTVLYVIGRTESRNFITTPPSRKEHHSTTVLHIGFDRGKKEGDDVDYGDGFIARFNNQLTTCISSSLVGGASLDYFDDVLLSGENLYVAGQTDSTNFPGIETNYSFNGTRGFISRFDNDVSQQFNITSPLKFVPQFTEKEIQILATEVWEDIKKPLIDNTLYSKLGKYTQKRISKKEFKRKIARLHFLYGTPKLIGIKFHHYNYYQNSHKTFDKIDIYYSMQSYRGGYYKPINPNRGYLVVTLDVKNRQWHLADVYYRQYDDEKSKNNMTKRFY